MCCCVSLCVACCDGLGEYDILEHNKYMHEFGVRGGGVE